MKGPILCFIGPPGVGKTSLGKSIARSLDAIRAHRLGRYARRSGNPRTPPDVHRPRSLSNYQGIKRAEMNDPVMMLDEVDKLGRDFPRRTPLRRSWKCSTRNRTTRSAITILTCPSISRKCVHRHGELDGSHSGAAA